MKKLSFLLLALTASIAHADIFGGSSGGGSPTITTPGGSSGQLQYNSGGSLAGIPGSVVTTSSTTYPGTLQASVVNATTSLQMNGITFGGFGRPSMVWVSTAAVDIATNTFTTNQRCITFYDATQRCVTENAIATDQFVRFLFTSTATFSGTWDSGMVLGSSTPVNSWIQMFAVETTDNASNFVFAGSTVDWKPSNVSYFNNTFGSNGYVYLGHIRYGDNSGTTTGILKFVQSGNHTRLLNTVTAGNTSGANDPACGTRLASTAGATTLTYTYSEGVGTTGTPYSVGLVDDFFLANAVAGTATIADSAGARRYFAELITAARLMEFVPSMVASEGALITPPGSDAMDIYMCGYVDSALGVGMNPAY